MVTEEMTEELGPSPLPPVPRGLGGWGQEQWFDTRGGRFGPTSPSAGTALAKQEGGCGLKRQTDAASHGSRGGGRPAQAASGPRSRRGLPSWLADGDLLAVSSYEFRAQSRALASSSSLRFFLFKVNHF